MSWRGKAIGGSIGSMFGPWGALAGAAAGHVFVDRKNEAQNEKEALRLLALAAGALYEMARADGPYSTREDAVIRIVLGELNQQLGAALRPHELAYLIDDASRINQCLVRLGTSALKNPSLARIAVVWLWRVAVCDGGVQPQEVACIDAFARAANLSSAEVQHLSVAFCRRAATVSDATRQAACATLGVPYQASADELKGAYRALSQKYHPDKHAGLDPDIRALTAEKFAQIKAAYDELSGHETAIGGAWYAKQANTGMLAPAVPDLVALCFFCGQRNRLPPADQLASARCPVCQALLVFERELAEQLV